MHVFGSIITNLQKFTTRKITIIQAPLYCCKITSSVTMTAEHRL